MDRLQTQFHPEIGLLIEFRQEFYHVLGQTIGAGGDGQAHHPLLFQDGFVHGPEGCRRSVGVAEGLEISDIFRLRPLLMHPVAHGPELLDQIIAAIPGEISRSPGAAKGAASDGDGTVPGWDR